MGTDAAAPTEDGVELKQSLAELLQEPGALSPGVAVLGGSNLDEGTEFMDLTPRIPCNATQQDFEYWARLQFGDALGEKVPPLYGDVEQPAPLCRAVDYHHWPPIPLSVNTSKFWQ